MESPEMETAERPARSFRAEIEQRLEALEAGSNGASAGAGDDGQGNSLVGLVRTHDARLTQLETIQAENTSNILRLSDLVQTQLAGAVARIAQLEAAAKPAQ